MSKETKMDKVTTEMMEHICDGICKWPYKLVQDEVDNKCWDCKTGKFVRDILNTYNTDKQQEWIPVNKILPTKKGVYQVTLEKNRDRCVGFGVFDLETKEWYENQNRIRTFKNAGYDVIAWMPIPDPYTKENN